MTTLFEELFKKYEESGEYAISPVLSLNDFKNYVGEGFEEKFNAQKLAFLLLNLEHVERLYRDDARNAVSLDKYMNKHYSYAAKTTFCNDFKVDYAQTTGELCGRYQAAGSISGQGMVREARHVAFNDEYVDVDVSNCHPVITEWICDNIGVECVALKRYINERESLFQEINNYSIEKGGKKLERGYLKVYMLMISYGCGNKKIEEIADEYRHPFIDEYVKCMRGIGQQIMKSFASFYELNKSRRLAKGKNYNFVGSGMSHLCQYVENQILLRMFKLLEENCSGLSKEFLKNTILCFDGLMIHKHVFSAEFNKDLFMKVCEPYFHSKGFRSFKLEVKAMDYHDKVLDSLRENGLSMEVGVNYLDKWLKQSYEDKLTNLKLLKKKFKYVGFYDVLSKEQSDALMEYMSFYGCDGDVNNIRFDDFIKSVYRHTWDSIDELCAYVSAFSPRFIGKYYGSKKESFILNTASDKYSEGPLVDKNCFFYEIDEKTDMVVRKSLLFSKVIAIVVNDVRDYNNMIFHPYTSFQRNESNIKSFNTFIGYKAKLLKKEEVDESLVQPWLNHIFNVFVDRNEEHFQYFLKYFQTIFKYPRTKTRKVMGFVSNGQQVGGKGAYFIDLVQKLILGEGNAGVENGLGFFSAQFNGQLEKRVLTIAEECDSLSGNYHKTFEDLKSSVTQTSIDINVKHRDLRTVDDFNNYIVLSNNPYCVKIEEQDDRFVLFKTVDIQKSKKVEYFDKLYKSVNQTVANHFYSYICYLDLEHVSLRNSPKTNFYNETQFRNLSSTSKFCVEVLRLLNGNQDTGVDNEDEDNEDVEYNGFVADEDWQVSITEKKIYIEKFKTFRFIQSDLFDTYREWCVSNNIKNVAERNNGFNTDVSKYFKSHRTPVNSKNVFVYTTIDKFEKPE